MNGGRRHIHGGRSRQRIDAVRRLSMSPIERAVPAGPGVDIEGWRASLQDMPPLYFVELAEQLRDRPRPSAAIAASADTGSADTGSADTGSARSDGAGPTPVWARALLDSLMATQRLIAHFRPGSLPTWRSCPVLIQDCGNIWQPRSH